MPCAPRSIPGFNGSEDCTALEQLLEGYDQQDQDQVAEVCNSPLFKYMDNDVSASARPSFPLPRARKGSPPALLLELLLREEAHSGCALPSWPAAKWLCCGRRPLLLRRLASLQGAGLSEFLSGSRSQGPWCGGLCGSAGLLESHF